MRACAQGLWLRCRRVHISQSTLDCLKGEFDVEPGEGGSRCDYLEEKGIETYLIIASKPEVKKTASQNGLNSSVSPPLPCTGGREGGAGGGVTEDWARPGGGMSCEVQVGLTAMRVPLSRWLEASVPRASWCLRAATVLSTAGNRVVLRAAGLQGGSLQGGSSGSHRSDVDAKGGEREGARRQWEPLLTHLGPLLGPGQLSTHLLPLFM